MSTLKTTIRNAGLLFTGLMFLSVVAFAQKKTPQLTDPEIASVAVTANQIDVHYAEIALKKSDNNAIRKFAKNMKQDHTAVIKKAVALATKLGVTPKTNAVTKSLLKGEKKTTKMLKSKSGKAFNKAYIDNEVAYHEAVISAVKNILIPQTDNQQLKDLLKQVAPVLAQHLEHAKMVQANFK